MRILIVNYRYFISGGPEKYMFNIKKKLEAEGHEVIPFSVHSNKNVETPYSRYFVEPIGGRDAVYYEDYRKSPRVIGQMLSRSFYSLEVKRALRKEIREVRPDLVYILHYVNKLSPSVIDAAAGEHVPVVLRLSDYFLLCPRFDFLRGTQICEDCLAGGYGACVKKRCVKNSLPASLIRVSSMMLHRFLRIYDRVDAFVVPSQFLKGKMEEGGFPSHKLHQIATFAGLEGDLEPPEVLEAAGTLEPPEVLEAAGTLEPPEVLEEAGALEPPGAQPAAPAGAYGLYLGRLTPEKGVETAILAYESLPGAYRLRIAGDDSTEEGRRLRAYCEEKRLSHVEFLGFQSGEELKRSLREARFLIVPSIWYENMPNSVLEAYQYGKPVLVSDLGSLRELVEDGKNGFLFPPGDSGALADCIRRLDDDGLIASIRENNRKKLREEYSPQLHYERLIGLFEELAAGNQRERSESLCKRKAEK